ncbi:hypothetical protein ABPG75_004529 [Micractinium tetrahymenae]
MILLRRRLAQAAGWAVAAVAAAPRSPAASSDAAQHALASAGIRSSMSRAGGGSAGSVWAAWVQRQAQQQQQHAAGCSGGRWRVSSWQQVRQQYTDNRGYQHFGGRGRPYAAVVYSQDARRRAVRWLVVLGAGAAVVWVTSRQEVPYTGRMHAILVDPESEGELGEQTFKQVLTEARMQGTLLPAWHPATLAVRRVGMRVARAATDGYGGGFQRHLQDLKWEFVVIDSPQVNAFVVPGGKVVVYTGLLRMVRSEDELAAVLAHESAHVVARHAAERITQMGALEVARMLAYWVFGLPIPAGPLSAIFFLPNSRKAETEADVIGIQIMARACYDPSGMVTMFEKMGRAEAKDGGDRVPKFLRTHPHSSDRIKAIEKMMPTAEGLYEMNGCDSARGPLARFRAVVQRLDWGQG